MPATGKPASVDKMKLFEHPDFEQAIFWGRIASLRSSKDFCAHDELAGFNGAVVAQCRKDNDIAAARSLWLKGASST